LDDFFKEDKESAKYTDFSYYTYMGSLPHPPCTENVKWIILSTPVGVYEYIITRMTEAMTKLPDVKGDLDMN
jgi:carbonic anhydrase